MDKEEKIALYTAGTFLVVIAFAFAIAVLVLFLSAVNTYGALRVLGALFVVGTVVLTAFCIARRIVDRMLADR